MGDAPRKRPCRLVAARSNLRSCQAAACERVRFDGGLSRQSDLHVSMEAHLPDTALARDKITIRLHPADNVVVALRRLPAGTVLSGNITTTEPVPFGHKVAVAPIAPGDAVRKYGQVIGVATQPVPVGAHVHVHNLVMSDLRADAEVPDFWRRNEEPRSFRGYRRKDGRA